MKHSTSNAEVVVDIIPNKVETLLTIVLVDDSLLINETAEFLLLPKSEKKRIVKELKDLLEEFEMRI